MPSELRGRPLVAGDAAGGALGKIARKPLIAGRRGGSIRLAVQESSTYYVLIEPESAGHIARYRLSLTIR